MAVALLGDGFQRVRDLVHEVVDGLDDEQLSYRLDPEANTIGWLVWHLTRVQDDHIAGVAGTEQVWLAEGWYDRFGLPFEPTAHGYGHSSEQVGAVQASAALLAGYHDAVHARTAEYLATLTAADLDRVVDENWDPPVTLAVRLVSILSDDLQHVGQAALIRGSAQRR